MKKILMTACAALVLSSAAVYAGGGKVKLGETTSIGGFWCTSLDDWKDIKAYATSHDGDGKTAALKKKAEGKCGKASFAEAKVMAVHNDVSWKDKDAGDVVIVQVSVAMPGGDHKPAFGLFGTEQIDTGLGV